MLALRPAVTDLILDVGAGGCWCSDLLHRLNRRSVAVDVSWEMLRAGRSRPTGSSLLASVGDMECLPFRAGTFDKVVCLNALHHVPDMRAAVREIARVLNERGVALFSEPGKGHAETAVAKAAVRDFGVLEQEIMITELIAACHDAGFREVRLKPMSYVIPEFELGPTEWTAWCRTAHSIRPTRALSKMRRALMELCGLGKSGPLFEETLGLMIVRTLQQVMEAHPVIIAGKSERVVTPGAPYAATIVVEQHQPAASAGAPVAIRVHLTNVGVAPWRAHDPRGIGHVTLGIQLLDQDQRVIARDHHRVALPRDVARDERVVLSFNCPAPPTPGQYHLKFDLVAEGVTWFEQTGSMTVLRRLSVS